MIQVASSGTPVELVSRRRRGIQIASSAAAGITRFRDAVLADSPVSYWRLAEPSGTTAADLQGVNPGTYVGAPTLNQTSAISDTGDKSVTFSGASTMRVDVPHSASLAITGDLTIEAWVNPVDRTGFWFIVSKDNSSAPQSYEWRLENTSGLPTVVLSGGGAFSGTTAPATGVWSHVAVTVTTGATPTIIHYLNGATNGTTSLSSSRADAGNVLRIGTRDDLLSGFKGGLDEVAIYNTVLTGTRIAAHYAAR